ncbi:MAG: copper resistance protein CopC [Streptosporangiales bacterium]|nr:copper resistance protein CopC [Streptosporangiales bacterium]
MSFTRTGWRVLVVSLLAGLAVLWPVGTASAHDSLLATSPKKGAVVTTAPSTITLTFSDDVAKIAPTVILRGPDGKVTTDEPDVRANKVRTRVSDDLTDGRYTVAWRVVSSDGHPVEGTFRFTVDAGEESSPTATPTPTTSTPTATRGEPSTTPASRGNDSTGSAIPIAVGLALLVVLVVVAVVAWRRRRT